MQVSASFAAENDSSDFELDSSISKMTQLAMITFALLCLQTLLGFALRHNSLGMSCPSYPQCTNGTFAPETWGIGTTLAFTHRWLGSLVLLPMAWIALCGRTIKIPAQVVGNLPKLGVALFVLGLWQFLLGVGNVLSGLHTHVRVLHIILGYTTLGLTLYIALWKPNHGKN